MQTAPYKTQRARIRKDLDPTGQPAAPVGWFDNHLDNDAFDVLHEAPGPVRGRHDRRRRF